MAPKKKQEKMALGDFLTNQSLGSWADEMDAQPIPSATPGYGGSSSARDPPSERRAFTQPAWGEARSGSGVGMGGRGASYDRPRYPDRGPVEFPTKPPYTAHLGNLAYDVTQMQIEDFFADCQITSVRIVEDKLDRKPKGFGYVEFASADGLRKALDKTEQQINGRNIKISVADAKQERPESSRDLSDWTRRGPLPEMPQNTRQNSNRGFSRNFDAASDAGSERGGPAGRKPGFFADDGKVRDFGNWDRKGPLSPLPQSGPPMRDGGRIRDAGPPRERRQSPAWGEGRSDAGSRPPRREFEPRPFVERVPTAAESDNQWRAKMRPDATPEDTPVASTPASPAPEAPKERPKLNLAKRTVSTAEPDSSNNTPSDSKASPFGAARPIDTATREREVDEKRQVAFRQKKEADDKAKEDKAARDTAARAARAERADRGQAEQENGEKLTSPTGEPRGNRRPSRQNGTKGQPKENGETPAQSRPSFSILSRDAEGDEQGEEADRDAVDAPANGDIIADKETKPQEPTVAIDSGETSDPTAKAMDEDGWSTVTAPNKTKNKGRGGNRALAS